MPLQLGNRLPCRLRVVEERPLKACALEIAGKSVVILGRDSVELVVVAAGASNGHRQKGLGKDVDLIVEMIGLIAADVHRRVLGFAEEPEPGGENRLVGPVGRMPPGRGQQVAGDVFHDELIVGYIGIEGADDIIAVDVGLRQFEIEFVALSLGEADQVQPVPSPALAVVRRLKQVVDHLGEGLRRLVLEECTISVGVGGRPVRSNVTRRINVRLSAGPAGFNPSASSLARIKRSIGERHQSLARTFGNAGSWMTCSDQCLLRSFRSKAFCVMFLTFLSSGHGAPILTQAARSAICASESLPPRGIFTSGSSDRTA